MSFSSADLMPTGALWRAGVRDGIYEHVFGDLHHEVAGFLLGHPGDDQRLDIVAAVPALSAEGRSTSVTLTQDDWADVHARLEREHSDEQIIGWYHSHPGFGIFLSEHDRFIHRHFFSGAAQVAYVVDPHAGREGLFGWRDGEIVLLGERETARPGTPPPPAPTSAPALTEPPPQPGPAGRTAATYLIIGLVGVVLGTALALVGSGNSGDAGATPSRTVQQPPARSDSLPTNGRP